MSSQRNSTTSFLKQSNGSNLRIELSKLVLDPVDVTPHIESFESITTPSSQIVQSFVKLYHRSQNSSFDVKSKTFGTNQTTMFNEKSLEHILDGSVKLIATKVSKIDLVPQTANHVEIVSRTSYGLVNHPEWMLQFDLVKTLNNPLEFGLKLAPAKALLVDVPFDKMDPSAYDYVSTSIVKIGNDPITHIQIMELIADVTPIQGHTSDAVYQEFIYSLAKDIFKDAMTISQFKRQSGFKRLGSNTIELSRPIYFKQVLPVIDTFYMTDKMDGTRVMLIIDEIYRRSGNRRIFLGTNINAVSDQVYTIASFDKPSNSRTIETDHTVLDAEMMVGKNGIRSFHCFDVIALQSRKIAGLPFKERLSKFPEVKTLMEKYELGDIKVFEKLKKDSFGTQIKSFYDKKRSYHIDGLVFTPEGLFHKEAYANKKTKYDRIYNTNYANTVSFKWKPLDQLTIDFFLMEHPTKKNSYVLCSGVDKRTFDKLNLKFFDGYKVTNSPNAHQYFPIQFEPYEGDFDYNWTPTKEEQSIGDKTDNFQSFDGMVGEFRFADGDKVLQKPQLIRLRVDRVQDIAKGEYYGNNLRYAELIYHSVKYPLTIDTMCDGQGAGYFADTNDWYKGQRAYNSYVKTHLMETYLYPKSEKTRIMDFACGHGQDLARSVDLGFDEVVLLDRDVDALYELLDRKYDLRIKRKGASANVHIKKLDLEESSEDNIKSLKLPKASADHMMINFAIHYLCHAAGPNQKDPLTEFAKLCGYYLKAGGNLMITTFDGRSIFDLLKAKKEWNLEENGQMKYSIKKAFNSETMTTNDQPIDVLLPFSAGAYYREYLVNYEHVQKVFEENGFKAIASDSFGSLLRSYKKQNKHGYTDLSEADKEYVSLYGYMILQKQ